MASERRIVVGVSGSLGSLAALHRAVAEARVTDAEVLAVLAWEPPGGEIGYRKAPCPPLLALAEDTARARLRTALEEAFAGVAPGVRLRPVVVRGEAGYVLTRLAEGPDDLLVVGAGHGRWLWPSVARACVRKAGCPVLTVPRPALQRELEGYRWRLGRHLPTPVRMV